MAGHVDALFFFLVALTAFFTTLIFVLITVFAFSYRARRSQVADGRHPRLLRLELLWTGIPLGW